MKIGYGVLAVALVLVVMVGGIVNAQEKTTLTVSGEGKTTVVPDTAKITFKAEAREESAVQAQENINNKMNSIMSALNALGVQDKDMKTTGYNLYQDERYDRENDTYVQLGYVASNNLQVTFRNLDLIGQAIDSVGAFGEISSLYFYVDENNEANNIAMEEAIANAREKAGRMAKASGMNLGRIVSINPSYYSSTPKYYALDEMAISGTTPVEPGEQEVSASVSIVYELI